jgi:hypothetical protein
MLAGAADLAMPRRSPRSADPGASATPKVMGAMEWRADRDPQAEKKRGARDDPRAAEQDAAIPAV